MQRLQLALWTLKHDNRVPEVDLGGLEALVVGLERALRGEAAFDLVERARVLSEVPAVVVGDGVVVAEPAVTLVVRRRGAGGGRGKGGASQGAAEGE